MKITGKGYVTIPGIGKLRTKEGAEFSLGGNKREPAMGDSGIAGFTEEVVPATLECTVYHGNETDIAALADVKNTTITLETDTGKTYSFTSAFINEPPKTKTKGGEMSLSFTATKGQEA